MDLAGLQRMKREGRKIVGVVAWDTPMAQIAERAGADLVSVGDSVGVNLWGQKEGEITLDEMLVVCRAVRRGVRHAVLSCDLPPACISVANATRLMDAGAEVVKIEASPASVAEVSKAGIAVFAEFHGPGRAEDLVRTARQLHEAGAVLLDFRHSGPEAGAAVAQAVPIPVLGGLGGGPWLDGRLRMAHAAIGYGVSQLDSKVDSYANVARAALEALQAYAQDVRAGRHLKGQRPA
jgi:3-methyl-2-oxobutanoate hydroxymethyltransferase